MALIVEAAVEGDLADGVGRLLELTTRHDEADAQDVVAGVHAEEPAEFALELAGRQMRAGGKIGDGDRLRVVGEDEFAGPREASIIARGSAGVFIEPHHASEANHSATRTEDGKFARYIPTRHAVRTLHEPHLVDERLAGGDDAAVFVDILGGERGWVEIEVGAAQHFGFLAAAVKGEERAVDLHVAVVAVLHEKEDVRQNIEELGEHDGVRCAAEKLVDG